jgi:hypothetical protein
MFSLKTESPGRLAFLGVLATAVGVAAIVWPGVTIGVTVALFAQDREPAAAWPRVRTSPGW